MDNKCQQYSYSCPSNEKSEEIVSGNVYKLQNDVSVSTRGQMLIYGMVRLIIFA